MTFKNQIMKTLIKSIGQTTNNFTELAGIGFFVSLVIIILALSSCKSPEKDTGEAIDITAETSLILTTDQFEGADMQLGSIADTVFHHFVTGTGYVDVPEQNKMVIGSYYGGKVSEIFVVAGQSVSKGDRLFSIDNPDFLDMQQDYLETLSQAKNLQSVYERLKKLAEGNVSSQKDFLQAETEYMMVSAKLKSSEEKLKLMQIDPAKLNSSNISSGIIVRAPFASSVSAILVTKGQWMNNDAQAVELVNASVLLARIEVFEKDISYLKKGQAVHMQLPDRLDLTFEGVVGNIAKQVDKQKRLAGVIVNIAGGYKEVLLPGMFLTANVAVEDYKVRCLPENAIIDVDGRFYSLVLDKVAEDGYHFRKAEIFTGRTMHGYTELKNTDAFGAGTKFLIKGAFQLIQAEE